MRWPVPGHSCRRENWGPTDGLVRLNYEGRCGSGADLSEPADRAARRRPPAATAAPPPRGAPRAAAAALYTWSPSISYDIPLYYKIRPYLCTTGTVLHPQMYKIRLH
jgi:hypothetical protein